MRRIAAVAAAVACLLALSSAGVLAAATLDQHQNDASVGVPNWGGIANLELMQPFTAGLTGTLDSVDLYGQGSSINMNIQGSGISVSKSITLGASGWTHIALTSPPQVVAGSTYFIILKTSGSVTWNGSCSATVSAGSAAVLDPSLDATHWKSLPDYGTAKYGSTIGFCTKSFAFRTYVITAAKPTPTAGVKKTAAATEVVGASATAAAASTDAGASPSAIAVVATPADTTEAPADTAAPSASPAPVASSGGSTDSGLPIALIVIVVLVAGAAGGGYLWFRSRSAA